MNAKIIHLQTLVQYELELFEDRISLYLADIVKQWVQRKTKRTTINTFNPAHSPSDIYWISLLL